MPDSKIIKCYVDGSYTPDTGIYSFGCVFLPEDGSIRVTGGGGCDAETAKQRNVAGEMIGAMYAVLTALRSGYSAIELYYDYEGIEKWVTGEWKSKTAHTKSYASTMREWKEKIVIAFYKVEAHSGDKYNTIADKIAKKNSDKKNVPKVIEVKDLEKYE